MAKEEVFLPVQMERLEIEPTKIASTSTEDNPFLIRRNSIPKRNAPRCACKKSLKNPTSFKRNNSKLLKEPVLKFIHTCCQYGGESTALVSVGSCHKTKLTNESEGKDNSPLQNLNLETLNVEALVDDSDRLESESFSNQQSFSTPSFNDMQTPERRGRPSSVNTSTNGYTNSSPGPSCSQQAMNPPCDVTIDELASYFETLVHIPKKMSSMAEMMYI